MLASGADNLQCHIFGVYSTIMNSELDPQARTFMPTTPQEFYNANGWGLQSGQTLEEFSALWEWAEANYADRQARNFKHGINVMVVANWHADGYEAANPDKPAINRKVLNAMALVHDIAGLDEARAAEMFMHAARVLGYTLEDARLVYDGILSTAEDAQPTTREESLLTMGDMDNFDRSDYATVKKRSQEFEAEAREREGAHFDRKKYHYGNLGRVANYLTKTLLLGGYGKLWQNRVQPVGRRMIRDFAAESGEPLAVCVSEIGSKAVKLFETESIPTQQASDS